MSTDVTEKVRPVEGEAPLLPLVRSYIEKEPELAAHTLEAMSEEEAVGTLRALPAGLAARLVPLLQTRYAAALLAEADETLMRAVVRGIEPKQAATILMHLDTQTRERVVPLLPDRLRHELQEQLQYPEDSIGRTMSTQFISFREHNRVRDVTRRLRAAAKKRLPASYVYVLGEDERLLGVLNMHELVLADPEQTLDAVMRRDVFAMHAFTSQEDAAADLSKRRYFAAPVIDNDGRMLGIIRSEDLLRGVQQEVAEDLQRMVGVGADERVFSSIGFSLKKRLPWLHVNLITAFAAAAVVALFEGLISRITVLAVFLPVVAGQGGNAGAQSLAIVMRGLVMREIPKHRRGYLVFKEGLLGTVNGVVTGAVTALVAWAYSGMPALGVVVGLGMVVNLLFAGLAGASIPLAMKALRLDPAQCSSIILTTVTDVVGFFAFLGFAMAMQGYLVTGAG